MKKGFHIWKILLFDMFTIEFGPVAVFFVVYYFTDFIVAALSLAVATLVALIMSRVVNKRIPWFALFSGAATIITSFLTYYFTAPWILIFKDTVYYFLFAAIIVGAMWRGKHLLETFFGHIFAIKKEGWGILERRWLLFFVIAGLSNELVRIFLTPEEWVYYKLIVIVTFVFFGSYQFTVSMKYKLPEADRFGLRKKTP